MVNLVAVVIGVVISMVVGMIWYGPLFGKTWAKLMNLKQGQISKGNVGNAYLFTTLGALVMSYIMAHFIGFTGAKTVVEGIQTGVWAWLGFVATTKLADVNFGGKPVKLYLIEVGYSLVVMAALGALFVILV